MNIVFLMDALNTVDKEQDTTLLLMRGAQVKGYSVFYLSKNGIVKKNGKLYFYVEEVAIDMSKDSVFIALGKKILSEDETDAIFVRTDPPFDYKYLMHMWLLESIEDKIPIINSPRGIRTVNEKVWVTKFISIIPETIIACKKDALLNFIRGSKKVVVKPTDGYGGQSVFIINDGELNTNVILEDMTSNWTKEIIIQNFIEKADVGDKRILLLNGEPLGAVLRVHKKDDYRNNFHAGGSESVTDISERDMEIISILKPHLIDLGLYFVGIDIIGDYLTEVNVTSPTCMQEMNRFYNSSLETDVIEFAERLILEIKNK